MIRKHSSDGIGYSVVELGGAPHVFASAAPNGGDNLQERTRKALRSIRAVAEKECALRSIVKQDVFLSDLEQIDECRQVIEDFYGDDMPATTYIHQPPCDGKPVTIEALGVGRGNGEVHIERHSDRLVIARHEGVSWVHCAQFLPAAPDGKLYERAVSAFEKMNNGLASQGVRYDQVVRTWLYLGDIVGPEGETQRYKELNRARTDFYQDFRFGANHLPPGIEGPVYPASTGIGTDGREVVISGIAIVTDRDDVKLFPLENPQQTSAFEYRERYSPKSPKFARAMAVAAYDCATIFISGTASITGSETRFVDDVQGQTRQTLENIEALISPDNFREHGMPDLGATLDDLALVRVYIKRREDYAKTKAICEEMLGDLPAIYAVADVCRPELLVEIEGIAFACPKIG